MKQESSSQSCKVIFKDPRTNETIVVEVDKRLNIGRAPKQPGLVIAKDDEYISANAIEVRSNSEGVQIGNTSTHSYIEIRTPQGLRVLFPGEQLLVPTAATVLLRGHTYIYRVEIDPGVLRVAQIKRTGTKRIFEPFVIAEERKSTLVLLCAAHFFPERYGQSPLKASGIAKMLTERGQKVTTKAVNNKLQRTREDIEAHTGDYVDDREALVNYLVRFGYVTLADVKELLGII